MKIAVCFSGHVRTGSCAAANIQRFIGELWDDCDFFIHTWDRSYKKPTPDQVKAAGGFYDPITNDPVDLIDIAHLNEIYKFKDTEIMSPDSGEPYMFNQWWSWMYSIELKNRYERANNIKYDYVVKMRPDVIYHQSLQLKNMIDSCAEKTFAVMESFIHQDEQSIDDVLYIADSEIMTMATKCVFVLKNYAGINTSPNTVFYKYLLKHNIPIIDLRCGYFAGKYAVFRHQCLDLDPVNDFEKCEQMDKQIYYP